MKYGLSTAEAVLGLDTYGKNEIRTTSQQNWKRILLSQFPTVINGILLLGAIFSFTIGDLLDGFFILAIILLNGLFGFFQEYKAERSLEKLKNYSTTYARVIRNNVESRILTTSIVPGDVVILSEGDRIPADGTLTDVHHLEIDEAILTGESLPEIKNNGDRCYFGTLIIKGKGVLTVDKTGMKTKFGEIADTLSGITADKTPLQKQLKKVGIYLSIGAVILSFLLIPIGIAQHMPLVEVFILVTSISVSAIPEGLPAVITIALALGTSRMARQKALVRKMPAIETLGAVQVLLVDKTGTLTKNQMRVKEYWVKNEMDLPHLLTACILGNTATRIQKGVSSYEIVGDRTDGALLLWALEKDTSLQQTIASGKIIDEYVFDVKSTTITTTFEKDGKRYVFVRGAPESIIEDSILTTKEKEDVIAKYESFAKNGLRVVAFGSKIEHHRGDLTRSHIEKHLTFLGIVGIYDPPREEVKEAIALSKSAGIQTIMVTGDNELTALAIAREIGLLDRDADVITGDELAKLDDEKLKQLLIQTRVFARSKPQDKLRLVTLLREMGMVVGVTGDGVNDALALKKADVGVAMGISGTDVAKEASDIILTDDNFSTLMRAIEEGRAIYANILKSITYLLMSNFSEIVLIFGAFLLGLPVPLLPTQILWINLATDGFPALALAIDSKNPSLLSHPPRDPKIPLLSTRLLLRIFLFGAGLAGLLLLSYMYFLGFLPTIQARTYLFSLLIVSHLLLPFFVRGQSLRTTPKFLFLSIFLTLLVQIIISFTPLFREIFGLSF